MFDGLDRGHCAVAETKRSAKRNGSFIANGAFLVCEIGGLTNLTQFLTAVLAVAEEPRRHYCETDSD